MTKKECPACFEIIECNDKLATDVICPNCKIKLFSYFTDSLLTDYQYYLFVTNNIASKSGRYNGSHYSAIPIASTTL